MTMKQEKLIRLITVFTFLFCLFSVEKSYAVERSVPISADSRIRNITYRPNTVFAYTGYYGYQARIDLDPNEKIFTISVGDSTRWRIQPVGTRLFIKPIEFDATTNMTIITDKRIYYFELYAEEADSINDPNLVWATRFVYPDDVKDPLKSAFMQFEYPEEEAEEEVTKDGKDKIKQGKKPEVPDPIINAESLNFNYSIKGTKSISPIEVFDDGQFTYLKFRDINADVPAIFQVMPNGQEALVNFRIKKGYTIIENVTSQFTLRHGDRVVCVFNEILPLEKPIIDEEKDLKVFGIF